jgi:uncharacterized lipoprotein YddW (UPF0748 family)
MEYTQEELQKQLDAIDKLSPADVKFVAKNTVTALYESYREKSRYQQKLAQDYNELLDRYNILENRVRDHKKKLHEFFDL